MKYIVPIVALAIFCLANVGFPGRAWAEDLPQYDMGAFCQRVASEADGGGPTDEGLLGDADGTMSKCTTQEQDALKAVTSEWPKLPPGPQGYCERVVMAGGEPSYEKLRDCVELQQSKLSNTPSYRY